MNPCGGNLAHAVRARIRVRGAVQGVGFRPFVHRLATEIGLDGWVCNDAEGVAIEVQGGAPRLTQFLARLTGEAPPLARVAQVEHELRPLEAAEGFVIAPSRGGRARTAVTPDAAICPACLAELCDPADRRYRYAFINCTDCGPRYTITRALPYDRPNTSMAAFAQCPACRQEYETPRSRRFHAQPNACPECGPRLRLTDAAGRTLEEQDAVAAAVRRIARGEIVALKGLGGFHLACDARNGAAVARLRRAKDREEKPLAVMFANARSVQPHAEVGAAERAWLESRERPIVLLAKTADCDRRLAAVAPGVAALGVMLPYTPLHYLLFFEASGSSAGTAWLGERQELALVMTSANPGGEPLVTGNEEACERLSGIADAIVMHDRDIVVRCDDSVLAASGEPAVRPRPQFVRRARGYTPHPIRLPASGPSVLACGAWLKNTVCITRGDEAFVSQHVGDLENRASCEALESTVAHLCEVLEIEPERVAHDLHPDFFSTRLAARFAAERAIPLVGVQHHHAHIAAVAAEHGLAGPLLGLALDGVGLGAGRALWGGELLCAEGARFERLGHLRELRLPGGDRAAREPWRMAAAALFELGRAADIPRRFAARAAPGIPAMLARGLNSPPTSSAGRWFDAAAALLGVREFSSFEGQAAMELEALARAHGPVAALSGGWRISAGVLDLLPLAEKLADSRAAAYGAALFHATLVAGLAEWVAETAQRRGLPDVVLGGGCFMNRILSSGLRAALAAAGLRVHEAHQAPPNDGGLSLGQAWVAMQEVDDDVSRDSRPGR